MKNTNIPNTNIDEAICKLHLDALQRQLAQAQKQVNWYENAPFSWMLRRGIVSLDRAICVRLTRRRYTTIAYTPQQAAELDDQPTPQQIRDLAATYQHGVSYQEQGPSAVTELILKVLLLAYRVVRKSAKVIGSPLKKVYKQRTQEAKA